MADLLKLPSSKVTIFPLVAEILDHSSKVYDKMHLIHIGISYKRNIETTIAGFSRFYEKYSGNYLFLMILSVLADLRMKKVRNAIKKRNMEGVLVFHGCKKHHELKPYLQNATVGACFIPKTPYYEVRPSTNIVEYTCSSLIMIATDTLENQHFTNDKNGVPCQNTTECFCAALEETYSKLKTIVKLEQYIP